MTDVTRSLLTSVTGCSIDGTEVFSGREKCVCASVLLAVCVVFFLFVDLCLKSSPLRATRDAAVVLSYFLTVFADLVDCFLLILRWIAATQRNKND